jgi:4-hydroxythreonine-4-phosphate dehydrogenase
VTALRKPIVGISMGDPAGIGPEVIAQALARRSVQRALTPLVFGDGPVLTKHRLFARWTSLPPGATQRPTGPAWCAVTQLPKAARTPGKPTVEGGRAQLDYVRAAVVAAKEGQVDALCTAPVSKEQIRRAGFPFVGHTELLGEAFDCETMMLMDGPRVRVALATNHLPLREVPAALKPERIAWQLSLLSDSLRRVVRRKPRLALCGLNPHAGEGGTMGQEELEVLEPAMALARQRGVEVKGPFAADGLFAKADRFPFDAVLAMYHDQGLIAAKALDFEATVNVTLGLPVPRTSPDHGVAYDIAGRGLATAEPMVSALLKAAELAGPPASLRKR